eukprot:gene6725-7434_t
MASEEQMDVDFGCPDPPIPTSNLLSDLIPLIYRLRALGGENGNSAGHEAEEEVEEEEAIMALLTNLPSAYSRADSLTLLTRVRELLPAKSAASRALLEAELTNAFHELQDHQLSVITMPKPPAKKSQYVSLFESFNFDSLPPYQSVEDLIAPLKQDISDLRGWQTLLAADLMELYEHPQWPEVVELIEKGLASSLSQEAALTLHALVNQLLLAFPMHFQGLDVLKAWLAYLSIQWNIVNVPSSSSSQSSSSGCVMAASIERLNTLEQSQIFVFRTALCFLADYLSCHTSQECDEQCFKVFALLTNGQFKKESSMMPCFSVLSLVLRGEDTLSDAVVIFLQSLVPLELYVGSIQSGFICSILRQLDIFMDYHTAGYADQSIAAFVLQLFRLLLVCLQPVLARPQITIEVLKQQSQGEEGVVSAVTGSNRRHHSLFPADSLVAALLSNEVCSDPAITISHLLGKYTVYLYSMLDGYIQQYVDIVSIDSDPAVAVLIKVLDLMFLMINSHELKLFIVQIIKLLLINNHAESDVGRRSIHLYADCLLKQHNSSQWAAEKRPTAIINAMVDILRICRGYLDYSSLSSDNILHIITVCCSSLQHVSSSSQQSQQQITTQQPSAPSRSSVDATSMMAFFAKQFLVILNTDKSESLHNAYVYDLLDEFSLMFSSQRERDSQLLADLFPYIISYLDWELFESPSSDTNALDKLLRSFVRVYLASLSFSQLSPAVLESANCFLLKLATFLCNHEYAAENATVLQSSSSSFTVASKSEPTRFERNPNAQGWIGDHRYIFATSCRLFASLAYLGLPTPILTLQGAMVRGAENACQRPLSEQFLLLKEFASDKEDSWSALSCFPLFPFILTLLDLMNNKDSSDLVKDLQKLLGKTNLWAAESQSLLDQQQQQVAADLKEVLSARLSEALLNIE